MSSGARMAADHDAFDAGGSFEATRKRQILLGLELTPLERLAWLDAKRQEVKRLREAMVPTRTVPR